MTFDLSAALEALVQRMQTNPSEFFEDMYRWNFLKREGIKETLTEDEIKLLVEGLVYVRRAEINNQILQALLSEPQHEYGLATKVGLRDSDIRANGHLFKSPREVNQMEQLRHDIEQKTRQEQSGYPNQYLKSFFK